MALYLVVIFLIIVNLYLLSLRFDTIFYSPSANRVYECLYVPQWFFSIAMDPREHYVYDTRKWTSLFKMVAALLLSWAPPLQLPVRSVFPHGAIFYACGS